MAMPATSPCRQRRGLMDEILFEFGHAAGSAKVSQRLRAPTSDSRPGGVDRGWTSSGELRLERQYRDRWRPRLAEEKGGEMESGYRLMVGIDWATQAHQVCVLDSQGRLLEQRRVEHRAEAIAAMIDRLMVQNSGTGAWSESSPRRRPARARARRGIRADGRPNRCDSARAG